MSGNASGNGHAQVIAELYAAMRRTVDDLPYTDDFELMFSQFCARTGSGLDRHGFWRALANARKASRLKRKRR